MIERKATVFIQSDLKRELSALACRSSEVRGDALEAMADKTGMLAAA